MILQSLLFEAKHDVASAWKGHEIIANYLIRYLTPNIFVELGVHNGFSCFSFCQSVFETKSKTKCFAVYYHVDLSKSKNFHKRLKVLYAPDEKQKK